MIPRSGRRYGNWGLWNISLSTRILVALSERLQRHLLKIRFRREYKINRAVMMHRAMFISVATTTSLTSDLGQKNGIIGNWCGRLAGLSATH